ncbi:MAG TPA: TIGR01777 family oxidoreductase [Terriglobia bacterium]|nr:TIGR01777 family oxidoreductase [Terriglobia bacterium]
MRVLITGDTGLIGSALTRRLEISGHTVEALPRPRGWNPETGFIDTSRLEGQDAIVHLAGENIASGRWTAAKKDRILNSRVRGTRLLARSVARLKHPPRVFLSASAIGFYGDRGEEVLTEQSAAGVGFLPRVCEAWESEARAASARDIRVAALRIGVVLSSHGGALARMLPPFRMGAGGRLGSGRQYMSWITLSDLCRAIEHVLGADTLSGPINAVSPRPVTNQEFTAALSAAVARPALLPLPRFAARLALGEMADALLLASTRVIPEKLLASGFRFEDSDIRLALAKNTPGVSTLRFRERIPQPIEKVFPFFASAANLDHITPPWLRFETLNPDVEVKQGTLIDYRLRLRGIPMRWQSEICDWDPPFRFVDAQRRGPYTLWVHEHRFTPENEGTIVEDVVWYTAPGGKLIRRWLVDRDLERIFNYRRASLAEILS